jgi:hypothetical protein
MKTIETCCRSFLPCAAAALLSSAALFSPPSPAAGDSSKLVSLDDPSRLTLHMVDVAKANHEGRPALEVADARPEWQGDGDRVALIPDVEIGDGVIEVDVAGEPTPGAPAGARGFTGLAFRASDDGKRFEYFYFRATNGRSDDQVLRNHSVQYASFPEYPWRRMRAEWPEKYESYADVVPRQWTHLKIELKGTKARFYLNGAQQPTLVVNDLKLGESRGKLGLWIGQFTVAHYANLRITPA